MPEENLDKQLKDAFSMQNVAGMALGGIIDTEKIPELIASIDKFADLIKTMLLSKDTTYVLKNINDDWWIFRLKKENIEKFSIVGDFKHDAIDALIKNLKSMISGG